MITKSAYQLTPEDFEQHAIWVPTDDLEDDNREVTPHSPADPIDQEGIYFISSEIELADGSLFKGYIRISWNEIRELALARKDDEFLFMGVGIDDPLQEHHKEFVEALGKNLNDVFPIQVQTKVKVALKVNIY